MDNQNQLLFPPTQKDLKRGSYEAERDRKNTDKSVHALTEARTSGFFLPPSPQSSVSQIISKNYVHQQSFGVKQPVEDGSPKSQNRSKNSSNLQQQESVGSLVSLNQIKTMKIKDRKVDKSWLQGADIVEYYDFVFSAIHFMEVQLYIEWILQNESENVFQREKLENKRKFILEQNNQLISENTIVNELNALRFQLIVMSHEPLIAQKIISTTFQNKQVLRKCFISVRDGSLLLETMKKNASVQNINSVNYQAISLLDIQICQFEVNISMKQPTKAQEQSIALSSSSQITFNSSFNQKTTKPTFQIPLADKPDPKIKWLEKNKKFRLIIKKSGNPIAFYFDQAEQGRRLTDALYIGRMLKATYFSKPQQVIQRFNEIANNYKLELARRFLQQSFLPYSSKELYKSKSISETSGGKASDKNRNKVHSGDQMKAPFINLNSSGRLSQSGKTNDPLATSGSGSSKHKTSKLPEEQHSDRQINNSARSLQQEEDPVAEANEQEEVIKSLHQPPFQLPPQPHSLMEGIKYSVTQVLEVEVAKEEDQTPMHDSIRAVQPSFSLQNSKKEDDMKTPSRTSQQDSDQQPPVFADGNKYKIKVSQPRSVGVSENPSSSSSSESSDNTQPQYQRNSEKLFDKRWNKNKSNTSLFKQKQNSLDDQSVSKRNSEFTLANDSRSSVFNAPKLIREEKSTQTSFQQQTIISEASELTLNPEDVNSLQKNELKRTVPDIQSQTLVFFQEVLLQIETMEFELEISELNLELKVNNGGTSFTNLGKRLVLQKKIRYQFQCVSGQRLHYQLQPNRINQNEGDFISSGSSIDLELYQNGDQTCVAKCSVNFIPSGLFETNPDWTELIFDDTFIKQNFPGADIVGYVRMDFMGVPVGLNLNYVPIINSSCQFYHGSNIYVKPLLPQPFLKDFIKTLNSIYNMPLSYLKKMSKVIGFTFPDNFEQKIMQTLENNQVAADKMGQLSIYALRLLEVCAKSELKRLDLQEHGQAQLWVQLEHRMFGQRSESIDLHRYFIDFCLRGIPEQKRFLYWTQLTEFESMHFHSIVDQLTRYAQSNQISYGQDLFSEKLSIQCEHAYRMFATISKQLFGQNMMIKSQWYLALGVQYPPKFNPFFQREEEVQQFSILHIIPLEMIQDMVRALVAYFYLSSQKVLNIKQLLQLLAKLMAAVEDPYLQFLLQDAKQSVEQKTQLVKKAMDSSQFSSKIFWMTILLYEQEMDSIIDIQVCLNHLETEFLDIGMLQKINQELSVGFGVNILNQNLWFRLIDAFFALQLIEPISPQSYQLAILKTIFSFIQQQMQGQDAFMVILLFCQYFFDGDIFISRLLQNLKNIPVLTNKHSFGLAVKSTPTQFLKDYCIM